ncbi:response regulator receiver protein [Haloterrigena turkmenica DSM 5511]|uniref:Response regulator receiver protein n=1 Tax=Haloterrigena turkmenica (strain ATCC 51198 / DSM 5511 / JCM 9101 / NCIMB 13204 / VKM B-1734 / 4k) TaxID=543526 RepID=D2RTR6_HALTV|nr:response regulator [Haloterrigena turkmenica]ADB61017.1 response regulator receiver protein [Haloterrigena turkmenica DSM 5511]
MSTSTQPTILVVEDERELADLYATWVSEDYEVHTAYDGRSALEAMSGAVDVVLLDRHMPDLTGDEVLNRIRAAGHDCWAIMVTAVDPGLDIVELDIDDYVTKPVSRAQLTRIIENLRVQSRYGGDGRRELAALSNKMETLEDEHAPNELAETDAYRQLEADLKDMSESLVEDGDR